MMITTISSSEFALKVHRAIRGAFKDVVIGLVRDARIHYKTPYKADEKKSVRTVNDWVDELLPAARERLNIEQIAAQAQDGMTDITVVSSYLDRREQPVSEQAGSGPLSTLQSA
jgi:hypothetical protein